MIYENIKFYAKKRGMSISEVERQADLARGHIYKWMKHEPNIVSLKKVADVLGVTVNTLIEERK